MDARNETRAVATTKYQYFRKLGSKTSKSARDGAVSVLTVVANGRGVGGYGRYAEALDERGAFLPLPYGRIGAVPVLLRMTPRTDKVYVSRHPARSSMERRTPIELDEHDASWGHRVLQGVDGAASEARGGSTRM
jgi:hypothetical protein